MHVFLSAYDRNPIFNINMQIEDGNKPPGNEQGVTLALLKTINGMVA